MASSVVGAFHELESELDAMADHLRDLIAHARRAKRRIAHSRDGSRNDNVEGDGTTIIIPGSDNGPGWDQIAPPSDPNYTTGGEDHG